jgi:hypothetical protein
LSIIDTSYCGSANHNVVYILKNMMSTTMPSMAGSEKKVGKKIGPGWIRTGARI